jgi:acyl carrier protein
MLEKERILALLQESMQSLRRSGIVEVDMDVAAETVLLGAGSSLDSMGFVTFVTDVEERFARATARDDLYIVLTELEELFPGSQELTASMFADYLAQLGAR